MKIALVDDDAKFLAQAARLVKLYFEERAMSAEVSTFVSAEEVPENAFDIYLLDVVMPGMNGIELARVIRNTQSEAPILFFSTSRDFAVEAFGIEAADYVMKPFAVENFFRAMDRALRRLKDVSPSGMALKGTDGVVVRIPFQDIVWVESANHYVIIHLSDGRGLVIRQTLETICEKLKDAERFARLGRQSVVNLAQITRFAGNSLTLSDGKTLSVPRRTLSAFKTAFANFYAR